jgi:hypothetical protein
MRVSGREVVFWISCLIVAICGSWYMSHDGWLNDLKDSDIRSAAGIVAQIGATMLGLVLAALAVLASIANSRLVKNMRKTGHYQVLLRRMFVALIAFGTSTIAGAVVIFLPVIKAEHAYLLIGIEVFAALLLADISRKFWLVLHHLTPD